MVSSYNTNSYTTMSTIDFFHNYLYILVRNLLLFLNILISNSFQKFSQVIITWLNFCINNATMIIIIIVALLMQHYKCRYW